VADIAREAATAIPTVYASVGGKSAILTKLVREAERDPIVEETLESIGNSHSPHEVLRITAHGTRVDNERHHALIQLMVSAAAHDDTAADTLRRSDRLYLDTWRRQRYDCAS
jgi:AcrR family transcriptional regulator